MIKIIKSYIAHMNWINAHLQMGKIAPDLALVSVRRAVRYEPNEMNLPKYMELQGHIESQLGRPQLARETFLKALKIIDKNSVYHKVEETEKLMDRILSAINELQSLKI